MICPDCGYALEPLETECRRCKLNPGRPKTATVEAPQIGPNACPVCGFIRSPNEDGCRQCKAVESALARQEFQANPAASVSTNPSIGKISTMWVLTVLFWSLLISRQMLLISKELMMSGLLLAFVASYLASRLIRSSNPTDRLNGFINLGIVFTVGAIALAYGFATGFAVPDRLKQ